MGKAFPDGAYKSYGKGRVTPALILVKGGLAFTNKTGHDGRRLFSMATLALIYEPLAIPQFFFTDQKE